MKFDLYIVAGTANIYRKEIKPYIEILNKYNFNESEKHEIDIDTNSWMWLHYAGLVSYAGTIEINNLNDMK